eukprot:15452814-Alexandrium_andersonii.AAC.1
MAHSDGRQRNRPVQLVTPVCPRRALLWVILWVTKAMLAGSTLARFAHADASEAHSSHGLRNPRLSTQPAASPLAPP